MEKNNTVVFRTPLMSSIGEMAGFLSREETAATAVRTDFASEEAESKSA